jgi:hypothetical protein
LIDFTPIDMDPDTHGPIIDTNYMTSVPNIFAAGNVLRGADMHDLCALEGKMAAKTILRRLEPIPCKEKESISLKAESPIRYVVPQRIFPKEIKPALFPRFVPGCSIQLEHTLSKPVIEARSGGRLLWRKAYGRLIASNRIAIPIWKFDLSQVDIKEGVTLKIQ